MEWKNLSYVKKGMIISGIIWLILIIVFNISGWVSPGEVPMRDGEMIGVCPYNSIQEPMLDVLYGVTLYLTLGSPCGHVFGQTYTFWLSILAFFILYGSLIGFIYRKIKNKNQTK